MTNNMPHPKKIKIIGLTGPSGAGKGTISKLFKPYGIYSIDTDTVYHQLLVPPSPCLDELVQHFGKSILTSRGELDRRALADRVFASGNDGELKMLNHITHKYVLDRTRAMCSEFDAVNCPAVIVDAPLLFESGFDRECDFTISVLACKDTRRARIMIRDGITEDSANARLASQKPDDFYIERSDEIIYNDNNNGNGDGNDNGNNSNSNGKSIADLAKEVHALLLKREVISQ